MKGVWEMKKNEDMEKYWKSYVPVLVLPSFVVVEDPTTLHSVILRRNRNVQPEKLEMVGQMNIPGLSNDPDVSVPTGMVREVFSVIGARGWSWPKEGKVAGPNIAQGRVRVRPPFRSVQEVLDEVNGFQHPPAPEDIEF